MYQNERGNVYLEEDDQCARCAHRHGGRGGDKICPFLAALMGGFCYLAEDITVTDCPLYSQRHLKVVPNKA